MVRTGIAYLPLHGGKAPRWLFKRMVLLSKSILDVISYEYGTNEFLWRISDPFWFQALSCVLGFDWHSSGTTTVTCGALKEAINLEEHGLAIVGGKGKASRKTIVETQKMGDQLNLSTKSIEHLQYSSRMAAKIDNAAIQDGYVLYHHVLIFSENNKWAVIQQGMNEHSSYARRYHWMSDTIENLVVNPHKAIIADQQHEQVLDMTAKQSQKAQEIAIDLVNEYPSHLLHDWKTLTLSMNQRTLDNWMKPETNHQQIEYLHMPRTINWRKMKEIYDFQPQNYEQLLSLKGVGPNTVRALALISGLIYGEKPSWTDPVKYTFTVGGKDGVPYPVDRKAMDETTEIIKQGVEQARIGQYEKLRALCRLQQILPKNC